MKEAKTVTFLRKYGLKFGLDFMRDEFGIKSYQYKDRVVLWSHGTDSHDYKYSRIVKECNGLILSCPDLKILCYPLDRFFSILTDPGSLAFHRNVSKAIVQEKYDGISVNVYYDESGYTKWNVSTKRSAFGEDPATDNLSAREMFQIAIGRKIRKVFGTLSTEMTYCFEVVSPEIKKITKYKETRVYLLAVRNNITGELLSEQDVDNLAEQMNVNARQQILRPTIYKASTYEEVTKVVASLPKGHEGVVCVTPVSAGYNQRTPWRVKIKTKDYVDTMYLRRTKSGPNENQIASMVWKDTYGEYLQAAPENQHKIMPYVEAHSAIDSLMAEISKMITGKFGYREVSMMYTKIPVLKTYSHLLYYMADNPWPGLRNMDLKLNGCKKVKWLSQGMSIQKKYDDILRSIATYVAHTDPV